MWPAMSFVWPAYVSCKRCVTLYDENWLPDVRKHFLLIPVFGNNFCCEQVFSLVKDVNLECVLKVNSWMNACELRKKN
jgi:hypothetical protein